MAGKHRKPHPLAVGLRTTGGVIAGGFVIGVAAASTQAFGGEAPDRTLASWASTGVITGQPVDGGKTAEDDGGSGDEKGQKDKKDKKKDEKDEGGGSKEDKGRAGGSGEDSGDGADKRRREADKPTAQDAIQKAKSQVGTSEDGNGETKFQDWYMASDRAKETVRRDGGSIEGYDAAAWCDMFISWVGEQIGFEEQIGSDAWTVEHARWFKERDRWGDDPKPGAIVFFAWDGGQSIDDIVHVGMVVEDLGDGKVKTVEGNTSNAVKIRERSAGQIVGYGHPDYAK